VETQPFRALFSAYDEVLPQHGLDPAHDQIYLRFLFKLGNRREAGQSLYQIFERLLEELGIQIEFNGEEEGIQEVTRNFSPDGFSPNDGQPPIFNSDRGRSRRASFNSMYDAEDESTRAIRRRRESRASMSRLQVGHQSTVEGRPSTRATTGPTEKITNAASGASAAQTRQARLRAEEFETLLLQHQGRREPASDNRDQVNDENASQGGYSPALAQSSASTDDAPVGSHDDEDNTFDLSSETRQDQPQFHIEKQERFYTPSRTQLLRDADTFQYYRIRSVARDIIDRWCDAALEARDNHESMDQIAIHHDTNILLHQAFDHWRVRLRTKKQRAETERFFNHLERRAVKARDLFLLTKAFTHWSKCAYEQSLETSIARKRVLALKYFYAWRDITIENQNQIQHQVRKKFFGIWKQHHALTLAENHWAESLRRRMLLRSGYWHWFWAFCERRAPEWRDRRLKHKFFLQWAVAFSNNRQRDQSVAQTFINATKKKTLSQWLEKTRICLSSQRQAVSFRNQMTAEHALQAWTLKRRYAPLIQQVSNMIDWRVAGATFAVFVNRYRVEKHAENVNRLRILRCFWTHWNDRLRWQTLAHRRDDRHLTEALYKWVIAERSILMQRLSQERLKQKILSLLRNQASKRQSRREEILNAFMSLRNVKCLQLFMTQWQARYALQCQAEQIAFEYRAAKLAQDTVNLWVRKLRESQKLETWAKDAGYYFLAKRYLKRWQMNARESRRRKRRDAYVQVRRNSKMILASDVLQRWRNLTMHVQGMEREADAACQDRILRIGTNLFDRWKSAFDLTVNQDMAAREHYANTLLVRYVGTWEERLSQQWELEETAATKVGLRVQKTAFVFLRKLRLRMIELRGQEGKADGLRSNYQRRHCQNLLGQWREKTALRQNRPLPDMPPSARARRTRPQAEGDDRLGATRRAEDWTEFDLGDWIPSTEAHTSTTPTPGNLSTPSKRAARAQALVHSTTPVGTPFQNRLRSQLNMTPRTMKRGGLGRLSGLRSAFGVVEEEEGEPRTPRRDRG